MTLLEMMAEQLAQFGTGPMLEEMPHCTLQEKGIAGSTAAHRIEEIHTPLNYAYITCTTGSSAFQNIVGVTHQELPARTEAGMRALSLAGVHPGDKVLICYPPLVNVFSHPALVNYGVQVEFIPRPSRDGFLVQLCTGKPQAVIGESSFLRAALLDAKKLGLWEEIPKDLVLIAAGSPLDGELFEVAAQLPGATLHDLYGCQEFGWLVLDGEPLREDIILWQPVPEDARHQLLVGGIATGDSFLLGKHPLGLHGNIRTDTCKRADVEYESTILQTSAADPETVCRAARSVLRMKGRIVRVSPELVCKADSSRVEISMPGREERLVVEGPARTKLWDDLLEAQKAYQREAKTDPIWNKKR